mmetsp:Transcript_18912/g.47827  ORF Transcript_18912/g.47827 Transcript_18912/m.47827 type:complete len:596 (-) Transcript_18912:84-1871(-)
MEDEVVDLHTMSRRDLQALAKVHGVRGNLKTIELITSLEQILAPERGGESNENDGSANAGGLSEGLGKMSLADSLAARAESNGRRLQEAGAQMDPNGAVARPPARQWESPLLAMMNNRRASLGGSASTGSSLRQPGSRLSFGGSSSTSSSVAGAALSRSSVASSSRRSTIGPAELWNSNADTLATARRESLGGDRARRETLDSLGLSPSEVATERVRVAVNAIRALRGGDKGCTFDQICDFIKFNPTCYYDSGRTAVQLHRALRMAVEEHAVVGRVGGNNEIRFSVPRGDQPHGTKPSSAEPVSARSAGSAVEEAASPAPESEPNSPDPRLDQGRQRGQSQPPSATQKQVPQARPPRPAAVERHEDSKPPGHQQVWRGLDKKDLHGAEQFVSAETPQEVGSPGWSTRSDDDHGSIESFKADPELVDKIRAAVKEERLRRNQFKAQLNREALRLKLQGSKDTTARLSESLLSREYRCAACEGSSQDSPSTKIESDGQPKAHASRPESHAQSRLQDFAEEAKDSGVTPAFPSRRTRSQHASTANLGRLSFSSAVGGGSSSPQSAVDDAWIMRESRSKPGKFYYYNTKTKATTWTPPK